MTVGPEPPLAGSESCSDLLLVCEQLALRRAYLFMVLGLSESGFGYMVCEDGIHGDKRAYRKKTCKMATRRLSNAG